MHVRGYCAGAKKRLLRARSSVRRHGLSLSAVCQRTEVFERAPRPPEAAGFLRGEALLGES